MVIIVVVVVVMVWHSYGQPCGIVAERTSRFSRSERLSLGRNDSRCNQSKICHICEISKGKDRLAKKILSLSSSTFFFSYPLLSIILGAHDANYLRRIRITNIKMNVTFKYRS